MVGRNVSGLQHAIEQGKTLRIMHNHEQDVLFTPMTPIDTLQQMKHHTSSILMRILRRQDLILERFRDILVKDRQGGHVEFVVEGLHLMLPNDVYVRQRNNTRLGDC